VPDGDIVYRAESGMKEEVTPVKEEDPKMETCGGVHEGRDKEKIRHARGPSKKSSNKKKTTEEEK